MHQHRRTQLLTLSDDALMQLLANERADQREGAEAAKIAFRILFERHGGLVLGYCTRLVGDRALADDIAQDVWMKLIKNAGNYEARGELRSWLLTITRNTSFNALRARPEWTAFDGEDDEPPSDDQELNTFNFIMGKSEANRIRAAIHSLPAAQRTALSLLLIEELSYEEIAQAMTINLNTVKTHIHRGRTALIAALKDPGGAHER